MSQLDEDLVKQQQAAYSVAGVDEEVYVSRKAFTNPLMSTDSSNTGTPARE